jgi:hypothetical protein
VPIPAGVFIAGSDAAEREAAYRLDERAYGNDITRQQGWYQGERARGAAETKAYSITVTPITNRQYAAFVTATGYPAPQISRPVWDSYGLIHPYARTRRYAWVDARPPAGREQHPVVLVSQAERDAFRSLLENSLVDCFRIFEQEENSFSWWDYRAAAFRRNRGLRIDHILCSETLSRQCHSCVIDKEPRSWEKPSDHAPVVAEFK